MLRLVGDGSYCTADIINALPHDTHLIGRFRKDCKLLEPLLEKSGKRIYGEELPTPEEMRRQKMLKTTKVNLLFGGDYRGVEFMQKSPVCWRGTRDRLLRLLIVMPIQDIPGKNRRGFRQIGYLLSTDITSPAEELIQSYMNRWQIEVLHRELKTGVGVGKVQAWNPLANEKVHTAMAIVYGMVALAGYLVTAGVRDGICPPLPRWRKKPPMRISQHDLMTVLRNDLVQTNFLREPSTESREDWGLPHRETYTSA